MPTYIYDRAGWPEVHWDAEALQAPLASARLRQGRLLGSMEALGFPQRAEASLRALSLDVLKSSEIEGELLNADQVRSSLARRLGLDAAGLAPADRKVDGVVKMTLDAVQDSASPLSKARLFGWHRALFPSAPSGVKVGSWRDDSKGPMQVVSGPLGREKVHFQAPGARRLEEEMEVFFAWARSQAAVDPLLFAAQAHLWFVTLHPFDDGNGRIARAIADWALARSEGGGPRYWSMSAQIRLERKGYYEALERTQKGPLDVTPWMLWFIGCMERAVEAAQASLASVLEKDRFWRSKAAYELNDRQRAILNRLLDGTFQAKLNSSKWAKLAKCSQDTAQRDIAGLIKLGILQKDPAGGRSTTYSLAPASKQPK